MAALIDWKNKSQWVQGEMSLRRQCVDKILHHADIFLQCAVRVKCNPFDILRKKMLISLLFFSFINDSRLLFLQLMC
jgi:uncharacterized protein YfdQ (DUF2303 family)